MRIEHNAITDDRQLAGPYHAGRQQRKLVGGAVDDERVAGIVAALEANHDICLLRQPIDDLALALVAPLRPDNDDISHRRPFTRPVAPASHLPRILDDVARGKAPTAPSGWYCRLFTIPGAVRALLRQHRGHPALHANLSVAQSGHAGALVARDEAIGSVVPQARARNSGERAFMAGLVGRAGGWLFNQPYVLLALPSLFFAGNVVIARSVAGHVPPVALSLGRWWIAFLLVLPFTMGYLRRDWPEILRHVPLLTVLALTGYAGYNTMAYYGLQFTEAINALLSQSMGPVFVALWTLVLFGERLTLMQAGGITISLIGAVVIICRGDLNVLLSVGVNRGDLWYIGALFVYAFYSALLRLRPAIHPLSFLTV